MQPIRRYNAILEELIQHQGFANLLSVMKALFEKVVMFNEQYQFSFLDKNGDAFLGDNQKNLAEIEAAQKARIEQLKEQQRELMQSGKKKEAARR